MLSYLYNMINANTNTNTMKFTERYDLKEENELLLVTDKEEIFVVCYDVSKDVIKSSGFYDYDAEPDNDETLIKIDLLWCYKSNEGADNLGDATEEQRKAIAEYLKQINED